MSQRKLEIDVFYEPELEEILSALGLLEKLQEGKLTCAFCHRQVFRSNFGAVFREEGQTMISCFDPGCMAKLPRGAAHV